MNPPIVGLSLALSVDQFQFVSEASELMLSEYIYHAIMMAQCDVSPSHLRLKSQRDPCLYHRPIRLELASQFTPLYKQSYAVKTG